MWLVIIRAVARRAALGTVAASLAVVGLPAGQGGGVHRPVRPRRGRVGERSLRRRRPDPCAVPTHEIGEVQGSGAHRPSPAGRSPSAAPSSATCRASPASTCRTPTATATPPPPTASSCSARRRGRPRRHRRRDRARRASSAARPRSRRGRRRGLRRRHRGRPARAAAARPPADDAARERLEGMLVAPGRPADGQRGLRPHQLRRARPSPRAACLVQPTELARPGHPRGRRPIAAGNTLRRDRPGRRRQRPRQQRPRRPYLTPDHPGPGRRRARPSPSRWCSATASASGGCSPPTAPRTASFAPQNTRPAAPDAVGGDVQVGAFNVLNYFLTLDRDGGRGATTTAAQFEKQAAKIVPAIDGARRRRRHAHGDRGHRLHRPHPRQRRQRRSPTWCGRLNAPPATTSGPTSRCRDELYAVDRDVIRNAIIYQPATSSSRSATPSAWSTRASGSTPASRSRRPSSQDGDAFTVVANHFKSKGPGAATGDNVDAGDGAGRLERRPRASGGSRWRRSSSGCAGQTGTTTSSLLGDFNAYTQEDPVEALRAAGLTDLGSASTRPLQLRVRRHCPARSTTRSPRRRSPRRSPA